MRIAQGIDITSREINLIRLACLLEAEPGAHRIEVLDAVRHPLAPGIVVGPDIVDVDALIHALSDCLARQAVRLESMVHQPEGGDDPLTAQRPVWTGDLAMSLCPSAVIQQQVALSELMPGFRMRLPARFDASAFDALEPWVILYAQKMSGIDPADLAVDWYRSAPSDDDSVVVVAAQRHYLNIRHQLAAGAGARLCALSDAATAALGACRFVVARSLHTPCDDREHDALYPAPVEGACFLPSVPRKPNANGATDGLSDGTLQAFESARWETFTTRCAATYPDQPLPHGAFDAQWRSQRFAALWIGESVWRAWTFDASGAFLESVRMPDSGAAVDMLAALGAASPGPLALVLVAGVREALEPVGGMRAVRDALACPAIEFDASACCFGPAATPQQVGPAAAVAFGLALQELMR